MLRKHPARMAGIALAAAAVLAAADLLPDRMTEVSRSVEEVRGRKFTRTVPASRLDKAEARRVLRGKISEGLPVPVEEYFRSLVAIGLIEDSPGFSTPSSISTLRRSSRSTTRIPAASTSSRAPRGWRGAIPRTSRRA